MDHDASYKLLFNHKAMMRDLLQGFVQGDWLAGANFDTLSKVDRSNVAEAASGELAQRHSDTLWKIQIQSGRWLYIYILLEFQSSNDFWMALRLNQYITLAYQDLIKQGELDNGKLPPLLPIVLYNGMAPWTAPLQLAELVTGTPDALLPYVPRSAYLLIDEARIGRERLNPMRNLAAALFRLEAQRSKDDVIEVVSALVEWLKGEENRALNRDFALWIKNMLRPALPHEALQHINELQEVVSMFAENVKSWFDEREEKGWREGQQEGRQEGRHQADTLHLQRLLGRKFDLIPPDVNAKIANASAERLEYWIDCILDGKGLEVFFDH